MNAEFKINGSCLETDRLMLRAFEKSDLDDFYEYASVEGVGEMAGWKHHESREKSLEILERFISEDKTFAICLKENGKVIGSLGVEEYGMEEVLKSAGTDTTKAQFIGLTSNIAQYFNKVVYRLTIMAK